MMVSAFADMTRRSRGVRLVTFGQDNQNIVQLLSLAQRINEFKVVPQYDIRGSITQFDEDVDRRQAGLGASIVSAFKRSSVSFALSRCDWFMCTRMAESAPSSTAASSVKPMPSRKSGTTSNGRMK